VKALSQWPLDARRCVRGVFTDIDDTLTHEGAITPDALQALHQLKTAGLTVIAITGRPVGWSEPFARNWPVDAIVAENGSVAWIKTKDLIKIGLSPPNSLDSLLSKIYQTSSELRQQNFEHLQKILTRIEQQVPGAKRSTDSAGRETDIAIDHSEFRHLPQSSIDEVVRLMCEGGLHATVSSIHINGWLGKHNKLQGAQWIVRELYGRDLSAEMPAWAYVGDSTNDQLMFEAFGNSVGVANIARFAAQMQHLPSYVCRSERGAGFAEFATALLADY
jgi:HAD superfamily hydrolase (TIGR01484 family)